MIAEQLLAAVAPLGVVGLSLPDPADASTWTFQPELDTDTQALAVAALQAVIAPPPPPVDPIVQLQQDVQTLTDQVQALSDSVTTALAVPVVATPPL